MKKLLLVFLLFSGLTYSQSEKQSKLFFSEALSLHLPKYNQKASRAYAHRDYAEAEHLFDSLVNFCLSGSYMDNFRFHDLHKKAVHLYEYQKPVYLITYASWCVPGKGEIPALNELAGKYSEKIDFVVLFWDDYKTVRKEARKFSKDISVVYVDENRNDGAYVVKELKHSLGLPTCFLLSAEKKVMEIRRSLFLPYQASKEESVSKNYRVMEDAIAQYLIKDETPQASELADNSIVP